MGSYGSHNRPPPNGGHRAADRNRCNWGTLQSSQALLPLKPRSSQLSCGVLWCRCRWCGVILKSPEEDPNNNLKRSPQKVDLKIWKYIMEYDDTLTLRPPFFISGPQILPQKVWVKMVKWISWAAKRQKVGDSSMTISGKSRWVKYYQIHLGKSRSFLY